MENLIVRKLADSTDTRTFLDGSKRSVTVLASAAIGYGQYLPGWQWSKHAGPQTGQPSQSHIGYIVSGAMAVRSQEGNEVIVGPGEAFEATPGHDAWVVGSEPCIALDFTHLQ